VARSLVETMLVVRLNWQGIYEWLKVREIYLLIQYECTTV